MSVGFCREFFKWILNEVGVHQLIGPYNSKKTLVSLGRGQTSLFALSSSEIPKTEVFVNFNRITLWWRNIINGYVKIIFTTNFVERIFCYDKVIFSFPPSA